LFLRVKKNGKKHFVTRCTFNGKQRKITLEEYPALKLAQAKKCTGKLKKNL
jgi:hypothetical protein